MENIGYLATCQWKITQPYCLPNKTFDILSAGLARGLFSVPFHCITAVPIFCHSNFNYWNKGMPIMTQVVTIVAITWLALRISMKHSLINDEEQQDTFDNENTNEYDEYEIDLTMCKPPAVAL
eukprot:130892_1